jgi:hypothetical protein
MFKNYIKIAFRNIRRYRGYSLINIAGLTVGMACFILIFLWVYDELTPTAITSAALSSEKLAIRVTQEYPVPLIFFPRSLKMSIRKLLK